MIVPSLLNSNILHLKELVDAMNDCEEKCLHIDVMDGHFVPMQAFGGKIISDLKYETNLLLDVHLMIMQPELHLNEYSDSDIITVHIESTNHIYRCIHIIKEMGLKAGIAVNPGTPLCLIENILPLVDQVIIMTVNPGGLKESFIQDSLCKIEKLNELREKNNLQFVIEVDGNINDKNILECKKAGANHFVSGGFIFKNKDFKENICTLKNVLGD